MGLPVVQNVEHQKEKILKCILVKSNKYDAYFNRDIIQP